ncbi:uncharacterized transmembrane protein DDB_G0289901-like [Dermacentor albipictus]|uniref:uncharacterized transmembrane protein DDB_G0289901-like n=1 Tax=Dermacentor albipictus TaxID=60249 RepID=UPI0031FE04C3
MGYSKASKQLDRVIYKRSHREIESTAGTILSSSRSSPNVAYLSTRLTIQMYTTPRPLTCFILFMHFHAAVRFLTVVFFIRGAVCQYEADDRRERYCHRLFLPVINPAMGLCTYPCLLLSHELPPKILVQWEPDGTVCKIKDPFSQELKTGHCRRGSCQGTGSYGEIKRIKRGLRSSIDASQRNNGHAVYTRLNRTAGAPSAATLRRQKIERRRRRMWFDCDCASQTVLLGDTRSLPRAFGSGSRGKRGKRRKVGCRIICIFLVNRYKHDSSWISLFEANSSSVRGSGIANASTRSGGNGTFHGPTGGQTGGASRRLNAASLSTHVSGMHGSGLVGSGGVRNTNNLAAGPVGVSVTNAATSGGGMDASAVAGKGNSTVLGIGTVKNAVSEAVMAGASVGNTSHTMSSVLGAGSDRNRLVGGDANGNPALVIGGPPDSRKNGFSSKSANDVEVGSMPLGTGSVGSVGNAGGSRTIAGNNSTVTGGAPGSVSAGGVSGSSATGAAGIVSTNGIIVSSTGLSGSKTHIPGGASIESGSEERNTAVGVVGSGSSTVVNTTSLPGIRLGISNGGLSHESVRNNGSNDVRGTESSSAIGGATVSTNGAGQGIGSFGSGIAASGGPAFPVSKGAMNATATEGGVGSQGGVGNNSRGISNGGGSNVHDDQGGISVSGGIVNSTGGSAAVAGSSAGNTGMATVRATLSTTGSRVSSTTVTESRRVLTAVSPAGAASGVTGRLVNGGETSGPVAGGTQMGAGLTESRTVLSGTNGAPNNASSSTGLSGGAGAGGNDTGIGAHSVGSGRIGIGNNKFPLEKGALLNSGSEAVGGATAAASTSSSSSRVLGAGASTVSSSAGLLHSAGVASGTTLKPGNNGSSTGTITTGVLSGTLSPGSDGAGSGSAGSHGIVAINNGSPNGGANTPLRSIVGSSSGASNVSVGGVSNNVSHVTIGGGGNNEGSSGGGGTNVLTGHASSASEGVRIGSVGNPDSGIGKPGSSGGSPTVSHTSGVQSSAGQGNMAVGGAGGADNIPAAVGRAGSSATGSVTGGLSNGSVGSPGVTTLAGSGLSGVTSGREEGVGAGSSSNRVSATPTDQLASGGANSAASASAGITATENEVGGEASTTLGMRTNGITGRPPNLPAAGGSEAVGGVPSNTGVEMGNVTVGTSNASITTGVPGGHSPPSVIDIVPVVGRGNGAGGGAIGITSSVAVGPVSGVTASTETVTGGLHGPIAGPSGVALLGTGAGEPRGSVSGAVSGGVEGVHRGFRGNTSRNTNAGSSDEGASPSLSTSSRGAGIDIAGSGAGREVGAPVGVLSAGRNEGPSGSHGNNHGADTVAGEGFGAGSFSNGRPLSFGGVNGGTANGFGNTGGVMSAGTWNPLSGAYNNMGAGYGNNRFAGGFGSMVGMQPYSGGNFGMGGVYTARAPTRRNIEIYDDDIFFQD